MLLLPFCYWWGPSPCMHDGAHFSLSRRPWLNRVLGHIGGAHMSLFAWYHQHVIGHHSDTNVPGCDPDLYHFSMFADHGTPGFRTSVEIRTLPEQTCGKTRDKWWRKGLCLRVPLTTFGPTIVWDMQSLANPDLAQAFMGIVPYRQKWMDGLPLHSAGRSMIIWLAIIHPITVNLVMANGWISGALRAVFFVIVPYAIHGCLFYMFSQVSHVQQECNAKVQADRDSSYHHHPYDALEARHHRLPSQYPECHEMRNGHKTEWAMHQVENALDYAVDSTFWLHVSNGLNLQVVHHLFPQVGWGHYKELAPIIRDVCDEFNVKYSTKPTFWDAMQSHYDYLVTVNDTEASTWVRPHPGRASRKALYTLGQMDPGELTASVKAPEDHSKLPKLLRGSGETAKTL